MRFGAPAVVHAPSTEAISSAPWPQKLRCIVESARALWRVSRRDTALLQRTVYNKYFFLLAVLSRLCMRGRMLFDIDDAVYLHIPFKTKALAMLADAVIVGNRTLEAWALRYNTRVLFIPTCTEFAPARRPEFFTVAGPKPFTLGWVGNGPAHIENLAMLRPIFVALAARGLRLTFVLVGAKKSEHIHSLFRDIQGFNVEYIEWSGPLQIPGIISRFDFGLMPLVDTEWNRGKCAMKVIEYMACGVPAIASSVGENTYVITQGENGYLPTTADDWIATIEDAYHHPERLPALGQRARETVQQRYTFDANIPKILAFLETMTPAV